MGYFCPLSSGESRCDGMRYNCAKNMAYIPNEGVDMHGDADPGSFSSSNSILYVSLLLLNLSPLEGSSCNPVLSLQARPAAKKIASPKLFYRSLSELWTRRPMQKTPKSCKLSKFLLPRQPGLSCRSMSFLSFVTVGRHSGTLGPAFSRNETAYSFRQLARGVPVNGDWYMRSFGHCQ